MQTRICVQNLSPAIEPDFLEKLFTSHGRVTRMKMYHLASGSEIRAERSMQKNQGERPKPRDYAIIEMRTPTEAVSAYNALNGMEQAGRKLDLVILPSNRH